MSTKTEITSVDLNLKSVNGVEYSLTILIDDYRCSVFGVEFLSRDIHNLAQRLCAAIESH